MGPTTHLLELQQLDLAIDRLRARKHAIESGGEIVQARAAADAAEATLGELRLQIEALDRDGAKVEHEIDSLNQKAAAERTRMTSGAVANARELEAMSHEVENLGRRVADREDELLAIMERRETLDTATADAERAARAARETVDRVREASGTELAQIDADLAARESERPASVAAIDPDTLELYEELRPQKKGVAAAALVDNVCQGCHEQLSAVELDRVRRTDDVARCEHCRRILVL
jgi:predicted  nucleic acid-binding Zn-ribbon protein